MFFAPVTAPPPPSPAHVVVVGHPAVPATILLTAPVPQAPGQPVVTVPAAYQYGACQAIHRIAWDLRWSFSGNCSKYNRVAPLPLRFGTPAPIGDWLQVLAQQLPAGASVLVDPEARSITVTP